MTPSPRQTADVPPVTDPAQTSELLQRIISAGTVERFDLLHEALADAERRGEERERARRRDLASLS